MGLNITVHCDGPHDPIRREIDWDGALLVDASKGWSGFAQQMPPQALTMEAMRKAMNAMYANAGRAPDRVALSPSQMRMVEDYFVGEVTLTVEED